uniref:T-cell surface glycoprotein CD8 alpha chain n=1 Tax=Cyanistes caeruleus TaxID=156563 RepID=A0A8C0VR30_CYACU
MHQGESTGVFVVCILGFEVCDVHTKSTQKSGQCWPPSWKHTATVEKYKGLINHSFTSHRKSCVLLDEIFHAAGPGEIFLYLTVKSFTPRDQGKYFCVMNLNQMLYFSPGQPVFLPGQQHLHPTSLSPAKMPSTSCPCPLQPAIPPTNPISLLACPRHPEDLNFFCHIFIWVPLAGACLLLFIALVITIVLCQRKVHQNPL